MHLLHVIPHMDPKMGGVCQAVRSIIAGLTDLDIVNEVVSLDDTGSELKYGDPFPLHTLDPGKGPWSYSKDLVPWLNNNFNRFDAIIVHGLWQYHAYAVRKALLSFDRKSSIEILPKIFVMPHGMLDPYFQKAKGRKFKAIRNWFYWKLIEERLVNNAKGMLFTCEEESRLARQAFIPYNPNQELVVGLGVENPPIFESKMKQAFYEKLTDWQNHPYFLFLSRIHEKKGVDILVDAYASVLHAIASDRNNSAAKSKFKTSGIEFSILPKLIIAGPGIQTPYGRKIQKRVQNDELLKKTIFFPGMLSGDAKWGAFYSCEAFILPSHQENFGIAIVEAMACGKPVIISDQVNIWREIEAEKAGIIVKDQPADIMKGLVFWNSLTKESKQQMGKNAFSCFRKHFSIDSASKNFLSAII